MAAIAELQGAMHEAASHGDPAEYMLLAMAYDALCWAISPNGLPLGKPATRFASFLAELELSADLGDEDDEDDQDDDEPKWYDKFNPSEN